MPDLPLAGNLPYPLLVNAETGAAAPPFPWRISRPSSRICPAPRSASPTGRTSAPPTWWTIPTI